VRVEWFNSTAGAFNAATGGIQQAESRSTEPQASYV
jgi:hypothetical protein